MPYVRTVKTSSGATAVQIVYFSRRGSARSSTWGRRTAAPRRKLLKAAALWRSRVCPERKEGPNVGDGSLMRCCAGDEGLWPFGVALRREASNHLMLRWLKTVVVSDGEKAS